MTQDELVTVCHVGNEAEAEVVEAALRTEGIDVASWGEWPNPTFQFPVERIEIRVRREDAERARRVIEEAGIDSGTLAGEEEPE